MRHVLRDSAVKYHKRFAAPKKNRMAARAYATILARLWTAAFPGSKVENFFSRTSARSKLCLEMHGKQESLTPAQTLAMPSSSGGRIIHSCSFRPCNCPISMLTDSLRGLSGFSISIFEALDSEMLES
jgi:hypothetical protein